MARLNSASPGTAAAPSFFTLLILILVEFGFLKPFQRYFPQRPRRGNLLLPDTFRFSPSPYLPITAACPSDSQPP